MARKPAHLFGLSEHASELKEMLEEAGILRRFCAEKAMGSGGEVVDEEQAQGWIIKYQKLALLELTIAAERRHIREDARKQDRHVGKRALEEYKALLKQLDDRVSALHGARGRRQPAPEPH